MKLNRHELNHYKDDSYYIIDLDSGESYSFEAYYHVLKESEPPSWEYEGSPAEYNVSISDVELFDSEGMSVGNITSKIILKQINDIMYPYFKDDADDFHITLLK